MEEKNKPLPVRCNTVIHLEQVAGEKTPSMLCVETEWEGKKLKDIYLQLVFPYVPEEEVETMKVPLGAEGAQRLLHELRSATPSPVSPVETLRGFVEAYGRRIRCGAEPCYSCDRDIRAMHEAFSAIDALETIINTKVQA